MDLLKAIQERKSIRAFKPDPIPKEKIEEILTLVYSCPLCNQSPALGIYCRDRRREGEAKSKADQGLPRKADLLRP